MSLICKRRLIHWCRTASAEWRHTKNGRHLCLRTSKNRRCLQNGVVSVSRPLSRPRCFVLSLFTNHGQWTNQCSSLFFFISLVCRESGTVTELLSESKEGGFPSLRRTHDLYYKSTRLMHTELRCNKVYLSQIFRNLYFIWVLRTLYLLPTWFQHKYQYFLCLICSK